MRARTLMIGAAVAASLAMPAPAAAWAQAAFSRRRGPERLPGGAGGRRR